MGLDTKIYDGQHIITSDNLEELQFHYNGTSLILKSALFPNLIKHIRNLFRDPHNKEGRNQFYFLGEFLLNYQENHIQINLPNTKSIHIYEIDFRLLFRAIFDKRRIIFQNLPKQDWIVVNNFVIIMANSYEYVTLKQIKECFENNDQMAYDVAKVVIDSCNFQYSDYVLIEVFTLIGRFIDQCLFMIFASRFILEDLKEARNVTNSE